MEGRFFISRQAIYVRLGTELAPIAVDDWNPAAIMATRA